MPRTDNEATRDEIRILPRPFLNSRAVFEGILFACGAAGVVYFILITLGA
jgi:hypothetical protein